MSDNDDFKEVPRQLRGIDLAHKHVAAAAAQRTVSFAEIKLPVASPDASSVFHPDLVIRKGNLVLEISNSASAELLSRIGGILHAE